MFGSQNISKNEVNGASSYSFKKQNTLNSKKGVSSRYNELNSEEEEHFHHVRRNDLDGTFSGATNG
jgi:hypothetical protein